MVALHGILAKADLETQAQLNLLAETIFISQCEKIIERGYICCLKEQRLKMVASHGILAKAAQETQCSD